MAAKKRGLGRGLNELLSATMEPSSKDSAQTPLANIKDSFVKEVVSNVPIEQIQPGEFQPRLNVRQEGVEQLAESIRVQGILQPIVIRKKGQKKYELVAGERRWRAAALLGKETIPAIIRTLSDDQAMAIALIENIQREDLNPIEEAQALKRLADELQLTHLQLAESVGKSRVSVTNLLRLLSLDKNVQAMLEEGLLDMGHARALLGLNSTLQHQVARQVAQRGLSARETERIVQRLQEGQNSSRAKTQSIDPDIKRLEEDLADKLSAKVAIKHSSRKGQGTLVIHYNNLDELEGILEHID